VNSVVFQMQFTDALGKVRPKTINFKITAPDSCNLKDTEEGLKAKKYLRNWELESV